MFSSPAAIVFNKFSSVQFSYIISKVSEVSAILCIDCVGNIYHDVCSFCTAWWGEEVLRTCNRFERSRVRLPAVHIML